MESLWEQLKEQMLITQWWQMLTREIHNQVKETAILARATQVCVDLHVTYWMAAQQKDSVVKTMIEWVSNQMCTIWNIYWEKMQTQKGKLSSDSRKSLCSIKEPFTIVTHLLVNWMKFCDSWSPGSPGSCHEWMSLRCWTPRSTMTCLLHDQFWWPGIAAQMQKAISSCKQCIQHEGIHAKAPIWPIIVTTTLELLHVDFTSIETMMGLDQPPNVANLLAYVTPDQTAKTVAMFLWQGYISIFRSPAKLLSDQGANFKSNIIRQLCEFMCIQVRTSPYHAQTNGQVEWAHADVYHREIK